MTNTQIIANLWNEFRNAIDTTYTTLGNLSDDHACLRDYARDISWSDDLQKLLDAETVNERQHRSNRPQIVGFSAGTAAKLILMQNAIKGAGMAKLPKS